MSWDGAYQETRSVKVRRGSEDRTIARWQKDGWDLVARPPGRLSTELYFRRVAYKDSGTHAGPSPARTRVLVGVGAVAALAVVAVVVGGGDDATSPPASASTASPSTAPIDAALSALESVDDPCSPTVEQFATTYAGQQVDLDATVAATRKAGAAYDVLLHVGDAADERTDGPALGLQGVTVPDLHLAADGPGYIGEGDDVHLTATVGAYRSEGCVLLLVPVATEVR